MKLMAADIVNLRRFRKAKVRAERDREAAENRVAFGRTKQEKLNAKAEESRAKSVLDRHRREIDTGSD